LFLYAGYVNHFNAKIIVSREGEPSLKLRPKDDNLAIYQAIARFGTSVDLAMFNPQTTSSCASFSKCASRVHNRAPCSVTNAAIHKSLVGTGVPCCRSCR